MLKRLSEAISPSKTAGIFKRPNPTARVTPSLTPDGRNRFAQVRALVLADKNLSRRRVEEN